MSEELRCTECKEEKNRWLYVWNYESASPTTAARIAICLDCYKNGDEETKNKIARILCDTLVVATEIMIAKHEGEI